MLRRGNPGKGRKCRRRKVKGKGKCKWKGDGQELSVVSCVAWRGVAWPVAVDLRYGNTIGMSGVDRTRPHPLAFTLR
jgi:hypothetical protein